MLRLKDGGLSSLLHLRSDFRKPALAGAERAAPVPSATTETRSD